MDVAIDHPAHALRIWDGGTTKLWQLVADPAQVSPRDDLVSRTLATEPGRRALRPQQAFAASYRLWRHRSPRPDSLGLGLLLRPRQDDGLVLHHPQLPEAPHRQVAAALERGLLAGLAEVSSLPAAGCEWLVITYEDFGPSSEEGISLAMQSAVEAMVLAAYRSGVFRYL